MSPYPCLLFVLFLFSGFQTKAQLILGKSEIGLASFYASKFQGKRTSFGERFNNKEFTAAHRTLPHNTMVEVTNPANNKRVIVRINDRGPFGHRRLIDVSKAAAKELEIVGHGVAEVTLRVIGIEGMVLMDSTETQENVGLTELLSAQNRVADDKKR
jgi:rare lipoprotein A